MENGQPADQNAITNIGTIAIWTLTGAIAAGLSSMRKVVTMRQVIYHVLLSSFISSCAPYAVFAFWRDAPWYIGIPISMAIGLTIFGISVMLEKTDKKMEDVDPTKLLPRVITPGPPPPSQEAKS